MRIVGACVLVVLLNAAMISDLFTGKIRNSLILTGLALGLVYQLDTAGLAGMGSFAGGVLLPFAITFPLFAFRAIGAGDVKLLAVVGGFLGAKAMPFCLLLSLLLGGGAAFFKMLWERSFFRRFAFLADYLEQSFREKQLKPYGQPLDEEEAVIHLSVCILFAALICMIGELL